MNREQFVRIARDACAGVHRPSYCKNPVSFDPHEWVLEALAAAYARGRADALSTAATPQPMPAGDGAIVLDVALKIPTLSERVRADLLARADFGIQKYGTPLRALNGRCALADAYQELLDAVMYLTQDRMEHGPDLVIGPYQAPYEAGLLASSAGAALTRRGL